MSRHEFLAGLHAALQPRTYLEIGVNDGRSLALARATSIGVDPAFRVTVPLHCDLQLVKATSDDFFARVDPLAHLGTVTSRGDSTAPALDLAFIDGMHLFEFALRDFMNTERHAAWWTVIVLDDMLPRNDVEASRNRRSKAWTGDVYKLQAVLAELRPDLVVVPVDTSPTGVLVVLGADSSSSVLGDHYAELVARWATPDPQVVPPSILNRHRACDPASLVASPLWGELARARTTEASRSDGMELIRAQVSGLIGH